MKHNLLIVEDHIVLSDGLDAVLSQEEDLAVVGLVNHGDEVLPFLNQHDVDLIILDIGIPGKNGLELSTEIKNKFPRIKILVLTFHEKAAYIKSVVESGAEGYLLKNSSKNEVIQAIRQILSGQKVYSKKVTETLLNSLQTQGTSHTIKLTKREIEIMKLIANEYTSSEIAEKLFISAHTVETHRKNMIGKLNVKNTAGLVRYAVENGYLDQINPLE